MFEIPDDDDLFSEKNLGDILSDISHQGPGQQKQTNTTITNTNNVIGTSSNSQMVALASSVIERQSQQSGSPKTKKMRVLTDVVNSLAMSTTDFQKNKGDESSVSTRTAGVSGSVPSGFSALTMSADSAEVDVAMLPKRRSLRKFPGPAGILPPAKPSDLASIMGKSPGASPEIVSEDSGSKPQEEICSSQTSGEVFGGVAWQSLIADLHPDADKVLTKFSVRAMLHKASRRQLPKGKVPLMVGVLESIDFQGTDASVVLRDTTGQMQGTLHREAVKDFSMDLQAGAALVLRQVSVISPSTRTHYLNITSGNIVVIYPAHSDRTPTVLPTSPERPSAGQLCREVMKHCVHAAEMELLEAVNAAKEAALCRLRQRASPSQHGSPGVAASVGRSAPSSGLFSNMPFQARGAVSSPFTPHRPRSGPSSAVGTGGFTFRNTASPSPQMRTPNPGHRNTGCGEMSASRIRNTNSSFSQGSVVGNSQQTAGIRSLNASLVTGQSAQVSSSRGRSWNSSQHQNISCRLQPPGNANLASGSKQVSQASVSASSANSLNIPSSRLGGPSVSYSSTGANSVRLGSSSASSDQPQCNSSAITQASSQQSKWSFKRKASEPAGQTTQDDSSANSEGKVQRLQAGDPGYRLQGSAQQQAGHSGTSVAQSVSAPSAPTVTANTGLGVRSAANTKGASTMWDDELDDDILSQLSDDF